MTTLAASSLDDIIFGDGTQEAAPGNTGLDNIILNDPVNPPDVPLSAMVKQPFAAAWQVVTSITGSIPKTIPFAMETIRRQNTIGVPGTVALVPLGDNKFGVAKPSDRPFNPTESLIYRITQSLQDKATSLFPSDPRLADSFFLTKAPQAVSSGLTFAALAVAGGAVGGLVGLGSKTLPLISGNTARAMLLGAASLSIEEAERAIADGESIDVVMQRFQRNFIIGTSEGIPIGRLLQRAGSGRLIGNIATGALEESFQEPMQIALSNIAAGRPWEEGMKEGAALGLIAGASLSGTSEVTSRVSRRVISGNLQQEFQKAVNEYLDSTQSQDVKPAIDAEQAKAVIEDAKVTVQPNADLRVRLNKVLNAFDKKLTQQGDIDLVAEQMSEITKLFSDQAQTEFLSGVPEKVLIEFENINRRIMEMRGKVAQKRLDLQEKIEELRAKEQTESVKEGIRQIQAKIAELQVKPDQKFVNRIRKAVRNLFEADNSAARKELAKTIKGLDTAALTPAQRKKVESITSKLQVSKPTDQTLESLDGTLRELAENPNSVIPGRVIKNLERLIKKPISDLDGKDARILNKVIQHATHLSKLKAQLSEQRANREQDQNAIDAAAEMASDQSILTANPTFASGQAQAKQKTGYLRLIFSRIGQMGIDSLSSVLGGGDGSTVHKVLSQDVNAAYDKTLEMYYEGIDARDEAIKAAGLDPGSEEVSLWSQELADTKNRLLHNLSFGMVTPQTTAEVVLFTDDSGRTVPMTADQRMHVVAMSMDPDTHDIMMFHKNDDGSIGLDLKIKRVAATDNVSLSQTGESKSNSDTFRLTPRLLAQLKNSLSPQQLSVTGAMVRHLNTDFKKQMAAWSLKNTGADITKQETWFPRHRFRSGKEVEAQDVNSKTFVGSSMESADLIQERTGGNDPLEVRSLFSEYSNTLLKGSGVVHMTEAIANAKTLLDSDPVSSVLESSRQGRRVRQAINLIYDETVRQIVGGFAPNTDMIHQTVKTMVRRITRGALGFNPKVAVYQTVSVSMLKADLNAGDVRKAQLELAMFNTEYDARVRSNPRLRMRSEGSNLGLLNETAEGAAQFGGKLKSRSNADQRGFGWIRGMDNSVIRVAWAAAEHQAMRELGVDLDQRTSPEVQSRTSEIAELAVRRTQPTFDPLSVSAIGVAGSRSSLVRAATMFRAQRAKNIDMTLRLVTGAVKNPTTENISRAARVISTIWIMNSIRIAAIQEAFTLGFTLGQGKEDEDPFLPRFLRRVTSIATGNILLGDPIRFLADLGIERAGEAILNENLQQPFPVAFSPVDSIARKAFERLPGRLSNIEDGMDALRKTERLIEDFAPLLGIPVDPLRQSRTVLESLLDEPQSTAGSAF